MIRRFTLACVLLLAAVAPALAASSATSSTGPAWLHLLGLAVVGVTVLATTNLTLVDQAKRLDPNGQIADIAELLSQTNEMLADMTWKEGNLTTGELTTIRHAPPGAIWNAPWMTKYPQWTGADGLSLHFKGPDGREFSIDHRASNCTLPNDDVHKCWIRHGTPPDITVDKRAGIPGASAATTCGAGAGSFVSANWHGFLRNGHLENC